MLEFLLCISIAIIIVLLSLNLSAKRKLKDINKILEDILEGNTGRRVMINNSSKDLADLVNRINSVVDKMCEIQNEKEKNSNIMSRMLSNISHDFKTPLTSLIGYIELIKASKDMNVDELRENLEVVHNKAHYLNSTLENFFYLSRLESKDEQFKMEEINLSEVIKEQLLFFYNDFQSIGIEPSIEIPEEDIFVLADRVSVERIINNLMSNSLKYGKDGDKVGVAIRIEDKLAYVEVWDNGKGIPDKDLQLIFERLYTVEDSRNAAFSGTGIGLSIVKQLVKNNGGIITVKSIPFERTSFIFTLRKI